ncbi:MAG: 23S rRNA (uridine(2552)-2'-O)-methyltransferase RlmE [Gammaproteobacteria bacterium]
MKKHQSKKRWLTEHFNDPYVTQARKDGYRSRAAYKLLEIQQRNPLIKRGMTVVDLGAAPGGWSQIATKLVGQNGRVIALDILAMDSLDGVEIISGDFREPEIFEKLMDRVDGQGVDLVISDMAPNISGVKAIDIPRAMYLAELAADFADQVLKEGGGLLIKVFQGAGFDELVRGLRQKYKVLLIRKPKASRSRSKEVYVLARGFRARIE